MENAYVPEASQPDDGYTPQWAIMDAPWFRERYRERLEAATDGSLTDAALEDFWRADGMEFAPNRLFDEAWYVSVNADVRAGIGLGIFGTGFMHYRESGFARRDPHWLFSEGHYFRRNPDLTLTAVQRAGYANGYDHYLAIGDEDGRSAHPFFDPGVFRVSCEEARLAHDGHYGGYRFFLEAGPAASLRTSWYFDPEWYGRTYPAASAAVDEGRYVNLLHHYLTNAAPEAFDPNPYFSEAFYLATYPDVAGTVRQGTFRNGFAHFMAHGVHEGRRPCEGLDLGAYAARSDVRLPVADGRFPDAFACWIADTLRQIDASTTVPAVPLSDAQTTFLVAEHTRTMLPVLARTPIQFHAHQEYDVTVVLPVRDTFLPVIATLVALHGSTSARIAVTVLNCGSVDLKAELHPFVRGMRYVSCRRTDTLKACIDAALEGKTGPVLLLEPGVRLSYGALDAALDTLRQRHVGAVAGQLVGGEGTVIEAGISVFRDGTVERCGYGLEPFASEIGFARACHGGGNAPLLLDADLVRNADLPASLTEWAALMVALCLLVTERGAQVRYEPGFLAYGPSRSSSATSASSVSAALRDRFRRLLGSHPLGVDSMRERARWASKGSHVLFLCERLPAPHLGGMFARDGDIIAAMARAGLCVTVYSLDEVIGPTAPLVADFPLTVEVIRDRFHAGLPDFLHERADVFDCIWFAGHRTLRRVQVDIHRMASGLPQANMVLDVGRMGAIEGHRRRLVGGLDDRSRLLIDLQADIGDDWLCQSVLALQNEDAAFIRYASGVEPLTLGMSAVEPVNVPTFEGRSGLLHALPLYGPGDAVHDGLDLFVRHSMPMLDRVLPEGATLRIAGFRADGVDLLGLSYYPRVDPIVSARDLSILYAKSRVMVAPSRVSAGLPYEVVRAAGFGLPAVIGRDLAAQLGWENNVSCLVADPGIPQEFAEAVLRLYEDADLWRRLSDGARQAVRKAADPGGFAARIRQIVSNGGVEVRRA